MSDVPGISARTMRDVEAGVEDWPPRIAAAFRTVDAWWRSAGVFGVEANDLAAYNAQRDLQAAIRAWESRGLTVPLEKVNDVVGARVNGALSQVNAPPLKWSDPARETVSDVVSGAKEVARPTAFGVGAALIVVGALYLAAVVRPWK